MNILFTVLFLACAITLLFLDSGAFLSTVLDGASAAASLCIALLASYAVWLGLMQVWEDSGLSRALSKLLRPLASKLFRTDDEETLTAVCMNLSANMLGIGGAATPYGIRAAKLLDKAPDAEYSSAMFFALNATSIQLLPTSIVGLRASLGSAAPADIILPTLLSTAVSTLLACLLTRLFLGGKREKRKLRAWRREAQT